MGKTIFAAILVGFAAFAAQAKADEAELSEAITMFTPDGVAETLRAMNMTAEPGQLQSGSPLLRVTTENGRRFIVVFYACSPQSRTNCLGVDLSASWLREGGFSKSAIQDFGASYPFAKSYSRGEAAVLSRYLTADYGFARGNLVVNVNVFLNFMDRFAAYAAQAPKSESEGGLQVSVSAAQTAEALLQKGVRGDHRDFMAGAFGDHANRMLGAAKIAN